jgi:L-rhamnose isomerase/sugar isomerase
MSAAAYEGLASQIETRGFNTGTIESKIRALEIETPSWGYGDSGTRFGVFREPGAARGLRERLEDAAQVNNVTGACPSVAIHIPWDMVDDFADLAGQAREMGVRIGAVNPNVFQDKIYKYGSLCNVDPAVRATALDQILGCVDIMKQVDSDLLSLWFADGSNYPGQVNMRYRKQWMHEGLKTIHDALPQNARMLVEYKLFEPGFYHTDIADWGMACTFARRAGDNAQVLVDLGHHAQGVNIEHIIATLIDEDMLGGFHFNNRKSADDDLTIGSINPYEVFLIFCEILAAEKENLPSRPIAYMIDQSHIVKGKREAVIQSIMNIQTAYAKACLVDFDELDDARLRSNAVDCERALMAAYETNVQPLLQKIREDRGIGPDPITSHRATGYDERVAKERVGRLEGTGSWG